MKKQFFKTLRPKNSTPVLQVSDYQFNDRIANACFLLSIILITLSFGLVWINFNALPPDIPLYFQRLWGESQLAAKNMIWLLPGFLLVFFLINYAFSLMIVKHEPLIARILGGTMLICSLMSFISLWNIMNLVIDIHYWFM